MEGKNQSMNFSPNEFQEISMKERQLRKKMSSIREMIHTREEKIDDLMKPVLKKKDEVRSLKEELVEIKLQIKELGFDFPTFRVEVFKLKGRTYYRSVWYFNSKKYQLYIGSEKKIHERMNEVIGDFNQLSQNSKNLKILEVYLPELQMNFWKKHHGHKEL